MLNVLHTALATCYLNEIVNNPAEDLTETELILVSFDKLIQDKEFLWPELCRLILQHRLEETNDAEFDYNVTFGPDGDMMKTIMTRLAGLRPCDYTARLSYEEKICLLSCLIDGVHDLKAFV